MILTPVQSSTIRAVGYDFDSLILTVQFVSGGTYEYYEVPATVHAAFLAAPSLGSFMHKGIRPRYMFRRVTALGMPPPRDAASDAEAG